MSIEPITIPMSIESNEVTIDSTFDARIEVVEGGSITVQSLTVLSNGTTTAPEGKAYSPVIVNVPASAVDTGTKNINTNGTHDVVGYASASVSVPASAVDSGTKNITSNGNNQDVVGYAAVDVSVPNSYSAADEGKVVSSGALVSQTAHADVTPTTSDQTIDTTTNNSIKVKGDADLVAGNIKKDVAIFGVTGTYEGGGGGTTNHVMEYLKAIGQNEFKDAPLGEVLNFTRVTTCGEHGCQNLQGTKIIVFPTLSSAGKYIVSDCLSLEKYDLNMAQTALENYFFSSDRLLTTIILRKNNGVHTIGAAGFNDTPFASGGAGGTLYVPSSLISSYQSASNWSTMLARSQNSIQAIEGSQYENYYADGTPI